MGATALDRNKLKDGASELELMGKRVFSREHDCENSCYQAILDVGSGNGSFTQAISATVSQGTITAIDTSIPKYLSV